MTFDLNGAIAVRAKSTDKQATEIVLTNSGKIGDDVTMCLNRRNLINAARMNFGKIYLFGKDSAVLARDEYRSYLFMPLESQTNAIKASSDCLRSPRRSALGRPTPGWSYPRPYTPTTSMPTNRISQAPATPANNDTVVVGQDTNNQATEQVVRRRRRKTTSAGGAQQAISLRDQLREVLGHTKELVRTLKAERRNQKSLKLALNSLKQLQHAA